MRKPRPVVEFLAQTLPRGAFIRLYGRAKTGRWPRLRRPQTFTDRLLRRMLDPGDELETMVRTGDKYTMRAYVTERLGEGHLPQLFDVIETGTPITPERVAGWPATSAMKASHASRWMTFVDRDTADAAALDQLARGWLARTYGGIRQEPHYDHMTPRVLVEEDLRRDGVPPDDVKFWVFGGEVRLVMVESGRFRDLRRFVADPEWRLLAVRYGEPPPDVVPPPPASLGSMLGMARELAAGLDFLRVDLYEIDGRLLVGELTHFPGAGAPHFEPRAFDEELGTVWGECRPVDPRWLASRRVD